jgi:3-hydroxybutyryl-CoA dehydrogenase
MEVLHEGFGEDFFAPPEVLRDLVAQGHLGQKTNRGFYAYPRDAR